MKNSRSQTLRATSVGFLASEIISEVQVASVLGSSSKGIYVKTIGKWLFFLSNDPFRGPLTINHDGVITNTDLLSAGQPVHVTPQEISLPDITTVVSTRKIQVWTPSQPSSFQPAYQNRQQRIKHLANRILMEKKDFSWSGLLNTILGLPYIYPTPQSNNNIEIINFQSIQDLIRLKEVLPIADLLSNILGSGPGLTPSADDFIVGLLLSLNRWSRLLWLEESLQELNNRIVEAAYEKTTLISANLIECASFGSADERLINTLDYLVCGEDNETKITLELLKWGNSSGVAAFLGMATALTA